MYHKILVPLDGSELAECVLPHAEAIVKGCSAPDVVLLRVVEPVVIPAAAASDGGVLWTPEQLEDLKSKQECYHLAEARAYLDHIQGLLKWPPAKVRVEVLEGKPAETVAEFAAKNGVDLVVIATHGRSGVSKWLWGGTADRILRSACVPVLMVRAPGCVPGF